MFLEPSVVRFGKAWPPWEAIMKITLKGIKQVIFQAESVNWNRKGCVSVARVNFRKIEKLGAEKTPDNLLPNNLVPADNGAPPGWFFLRMSRKRATDSIGDWQVTHLIQVRRVYRVCRLCRVNLVYGVNSQIESKPEAGQSEEFNRLVRLVRFFATNLMKMSTFQDSFDIFWCFRIENLIKGMFLKHDTEKTCKIQGERKKCRTWFLGFCQV